MVTPYPAALFVFALLASLITLTPARAEGALFQILSDSPGGGLVQGEMTAVTIRALYDRPIANEKLHIPASDAFDWIQTRADDWYESRIEGKNWMVFERHLALWPKRTGILTFGPVTHQLTVIGTDSQRRDESRKSDVLSLSVAPHPETDPNTWRFAARELELVDELSSDPAQLPDGGTVTRRVTLRALGTLPEYMPPRPVVSENWLITFALPTKRELILTNDGPMTELVWEWQFRPEHGEPGVLESVEIPWFNATTRQMELAKIPTITIGYASYYTGKTPKGQFSYHTKVTLLLVIGAGLLAGIALASAYLAPARSESAQRVMRARLSLANWARLLAARVKGRALRERGLRARLGLSGPRDARLDDQIYARRES